MEGRTLSIQKFTHSKCMGVTAVLTCVLSHLVNPLQTYDLYKNDGNSLVKMKYKERCRTQPSIAVSLEAYRKLKTIYLAQKMQGEDHYVKIF